MAISSKVAVFVLNLERDVKRRTHMQRMLAMLNIQGEFVPAIEGTTLSQRDLAMYDARKALRIYGTEMLLGELGCYLSHYRLYLRIVKDHIPYALILEDDIHIQSTLPDIVNDLVADPMPEWLIVRLDTMRLKVREPSSKKFTGTLIQNMRHGQLFRLRVHALGSAAYLITHAGAQRMLDYGRDIFMPIDHTMGRFWENGITPYVVRPFPVKQLPQFETSIGNRPPKRHKNLPWNLYLQKRYQRIVDSIQKRVWSFTH